MYLDPLSKAGGTATDDHDHEISSAREVTSLGDHDGDGYGDLAVVVVDRTTTDLEIYEGSASGLGSSAAASIEVSSMYMALRGGGDFDNDGYDDLVYGPYLFVGPLSGTLVADDDAHGVFATDAMSWAAESAGFADLDGDGYAELLMGSYIDSETFSYAGALWVVPGQ